MILQALKEYYDRKAADPESGIAPEGWEKKEIPFIVVLDKDGSLINIEDTREGEGKKKRAKTFLVPRTEGRSSNIAANLLWDKAEYIFPGIDIKSTKKSEEKLKKQRDAFINSLEQKLDDMASVQPVIALLKSITITKLSSEASWEDIRKSNPYLSFRYVHENDLICNRKDVTEKINSFEVGNNEKSDKDSKEGICLVSGKKGLIVRTHNKTHINRDNNSLISFQKSSGYDSYGKEQGYNAPVSKSSEFAYVTALNVLLKSERQKFIIGDTTYVCWSSEKTNFETEFSGFFSTPLIDNPDRYSQEVKELFKSVYSGTYLEREGNQKFYLLGLSPGGGTRISVRFWDVRTIAQFATNIRQYFDDTTIIKPSNFAEYFSLSHLLESIAQQGKADKVPPLLAGEIMRSIICGLPYPETLLHAALRRTHSGIKQKSKAGREIVERVTPEIAALIKAYINRYYQFYPNTKHKEVTIKLDISQTSTGYQLGRLFATLEKVQKEANPKINTTIRERFYGAACATPVTVFTNLLRLNNHHLAKLEQKGKKIYFEKLISEIVSNITEFPAHMNLHEQGRFAIGYYHQKQAFYTPGNK